MEFGVIGSCFSAYPWRDFLDTAWRSGAEAVELDTRPTAHCSTWSPDTDPEAALADLKAYGLRVGALVAYHDLVQEEETALAREVEQVHDLLDLAFRLRSEVVRLAPPEPKPGLSREAMLASYSQGCRALLEFAEGNGMLLCVHPDPVVLRDAETVVRLVEETESYNLRVVLDVATLLQGLGSAEAVRKSVLELLPYTGHVILRDARLNRGQGGVTEVPMGEGECPVELVVSELLTRSFYRPFYVGYFGEANVAEVVRQGIEYFRELPDRLMAEAGIL